MTEQEAIKNINTYIYSELERIPKQLLESLKLACFTLREVQQYRAIGTPDELKQLKENGAFTGVELAQLAAMQMKLKKYQAIGTVEECRAAVEKQKEKKPIRNDLCSCPSCGTHNDVIKKRRNTVAFDTVYCWHCGQAIKIDRLE